MSDFHQMTQDGLHLQPGPHYWSANSAPFYLRHYLQSSPHATQSIDNATIILVDDYCYKLWWIAQASVSMLANPMLQLAAVCCAAGALMEGPGPQTCPGQ